MSSDLKTMYLSALPASPKHYYKCINKKLKKMGGTNKLGERSATVKHNGSFEIEDATEEFMAVLARHT